MIPALSLGFGGLIGFIHGALGGGGGILILPVLVYVLSIPPKEAVVPTVTIVGITSLFAAFLHWREGRVSLKIAAVFTAVGAGGAYSGARLSRLVPDQVLMIALTAVMAVVSVLMLRSAQAEKNANSEPADFGAAKWPLVAVAAFLAGGLSGSLGVGAGFLIVPALTLVAGLPIKKAVGTSLAVIAVNCGSGLLFHRGTPIPWLVVLPFLAGSLSTSIVAARFAHRAAAATIKRMSAALLVILAVLILFNNL